MAKGRRSQETCVKQEDVLDDNDEYVLCKRSGSGELEMLASGRDNCLERLDPGVDPTASIKHVTRSLTRSAGDVPTTTQRDVPNDIDRGRAPFRADEVELGHPAHSRTARLPQLITSDASRALFKKEVDESPSPVPIETSSFRIDDEEKVKAYLFSRLVHLQQQADKRIAKAWIKGICPKKQARYPYQNNSRKNGGRHAVPEWWPTDVCLFKEPDHIGKEDRMALCLHILRLRPNVDQLVDWNQNRDADELRKTYESHGWTGLLKQMTPKTIFDGLDSDQPEKRRRRDTILTQMYDVAQMEEEYLQGLRDAEDMITWDDEPEPIRRRRTMVNKRSRQSSISSNQSSSQSEPDCKKARCDYEGQLPSPHSQMTSRMSDATLSDLPYANIVVQPPNVARHYADFSNAVHGGFPPRQITTDHALGIDSYQDGSAPSSLDSSFGRGHPATSQTMETCEMYRFSAGVCTETPAHQKYFQAYSAYDMPAPMIETVPDTPAFSPISAGPSGGIPADGFAQRNGYYSINASYGLGSMPQLNDGFGLPGPIATHQLTPQHMDPVGFGVPEHHPSMLDYQTQPHGDYESHPCAPESHGLPCDPYYHLRHPSQRDSPYYVRHETGSMGDLPSKALPGSVTRGFTGYGSGNGGGAWV